MWREHIIEAHEKVTTAVRYAEQMQTDRYFVWQDDDANDLTADDRHTERAVMGSTDLFTKIPHDPWAEELEKAFDESPFIAWKRNTVQYEPETGFFHIEWRWEVV